jgi:hypothetical protein
MRKASIFIDGQPALKNANFIKLSRDLVELIDYLHRDVSQQNRKFPRSAVAETFKTLKKLYRLQNSVAVSSLYNVLKMRKTDRHTKLFPNKDEVLTWPIQCACNHVSSVNILLGTKGDCLGCNQHILDTVRVSATILRNPTDRPRGGSLITITVEEVKFWAVVTGVSVEALLFLDKLRMSEGDKSIHEKRRRVADVFGAPASWKMNKPLVVLDFEEMDEFEACVFEHFQEFRFK